MSAAATVQLSMPRWAHHPGRPLRELDRIVLGRVVGEPDSPRAGHSGTSSPIRSAQSMASAGRACAARRGAAASRKNSRFPAGPRAARRRAPAAPARPHGGAQRGAQHLAVDGPVAHDAAGGTAPASLELRLHEGDHAAARLEAGGRGWKDQAQRDEADVDDRTG